MHSLESRRRALYLELQKLELAYEYAEDGDELLEIDSQIESLVDEISELEERIEKHSH